MDELKKFQISDALQHQIGYIRYICYLKVRIKLMNSNQIVGSIPYNNLFSFQ